MASPSDKPQSVISLLEESEKVAQEILRDFSKGTSVETIARKCLLLAKLTRNERRELLVNLFLAGGEDTINRMLSLLSENQEIEPETVATFADGLNCFILEGQGLTVEALSKEMMPAISKGELRFKRRSSEIIVEKRGLKRRYERAYLAHSLPEAETFVKSARKQIKYESLQITFQRSVETVEAVLNRVKDHLYRFALDTYVEIRFGKIPQSIFEEQRRFVDTKLAVLCPSALEKFAVAYEELQGKSAENWTNAVLACRRILLDFADAVFPPSSDNFKGRDVGAESYVNRLWAYAETAIESAKNRALVQVELADLGNRIDAVYDISCKGVHADIGRDEADRIVIKTYLLLADLLKLSQ